MPTIATLAAQLVGEIPGLPRLVAVQHIQKALIEIKRDYLWSWNINEGVLIIPEGVTSGTVSVTKYSASVTFDAIAKAVLDTLVLANPPLTKRQFRTSSSGPIYNIIAYDSGTGVATLDRIFTEDTNSTATYLVYKCYFDPPLIDGVTTETNFLRYLSILNPIQGYSIAAARLNRPRAELNRRDPLRGSIGQPYFAFVYRPVLQTGSALDASNGLIQYELWPHCTTSVTLLCQYQMGTQTPALTDYIPLTCPETLVTYRALELSYRWAMQNSGRIPELKGVDWRFLLTEIQKKYMIELVSAKRNDKEILLNIIKMNSATQYDFFGADFWQNHGYFAP